MRAVPQRHAKQKRRVLPALLLLCAKAGVRRRLSVRVRVRPTARLTTVARLVQRLDRVGAVVKILVVLRVVGNVDWVKVPELLGDRVVRLDLKMVLWTIK